jgi:hypothetical protein
VRASILHPIAERRRGESAASQGESHGKRRALRVKAWRVREDETPIEELPLAHLHVAEPTGEIIASRANDLEVARVRAAGGPLDRAVYVCCCGFYFDASVSTTVPCPHCGAEQAW